MSDASIARRFWGSLTVADPVPASVTRARSRADYSIWWRLWASFTGIHLPVQADAAAETQPVTFRRARPARSVWAAEDHGTRWFTLPQVPVLAGLSAGDSRSAIAEISLPGDRAIIILRQSTLGTGRFNVEVLLHGPSAQPSVVSLRYGTRRGQRMLFIPVAEDVTGLAASIAELPGFDPEQSWQASGPEPPDQVADWDAESAVMSIQAAGNEATRDAWRKVADIISDELRGIIRRALP